MSLKKNLAEIEEKHKESSARISSIEEDINFIKNFSNLLREIIKNRSKTNCPTLTLILLVLTLLLGLIADILLFYEFF